MNKSTLSCLRYYRLLIRIAIFHRLSFHVFTQVRLGVWCPVLAVDFSNLNIFIMLSREDHVRLLALCLVQGYFKVLCHVFCILCESYASCIILQLSPGWRSR